jgi:hypothetical protein
MIWKLSIMFSSWVSVRLVQPHYLQIGPADLVSRPRMVMIPV